MVKVTRSIDGTYCADSAATLAKGLGGLSGVGKAVVRLGKKLLGASS
jgi:hypothetical protein